MEWKGEFDHSERSGRIIKNYRWIKKNRLNHDRGKSILSVIKLHMQRSWGEHSEC